MFLTISDFEAEIVSELKEYGKSTQVNIIKFRDYKQILMLYPFSTVNGIKRFAMKDLFSIFILFGYTHKKYILSC